MGEYPIELVLVHNTNNIEHRNSGVYFEVGVAHLDVIERLRQQVHVNEVEQEPTERFVVVGLHFL